MPLDAPTGGATGARVGERQAGQRRMQASTGHEGGREGALRSAAALKARMHGYIVQQAAESRMLLGTVARTAQDIDTIAHGCPIDLAAIAQGRAAHGAHIRQSPQAGRPR